MQPVLFLSVSRFHASDLWTEFGINSRGDLFLQHNSTFKRLLSVDREFGGNANKWLSIPYIEGLFPLRIRIDFLDRLIIFCNRKIYFFDSVTLTPLMEFDAQQESTDLTINKCGDLLISDTTGVANIPVITEDVDPIIVLARDKRYSVYTTWGPEKTLILEDEHGIYIQDLKQTATPVKMFSYNSDSIIYSISETLEGHVLVEQNCSLFKYCLQISHH